MGDSNHTAAHRRGNLGDARVAQIDTGIFPSRALVAATDLVGGGIHRDGQHGSQVYDGLRSVAPNASVWFYRALGGGASGATQWARVAWAIRHAVASEVEAIILPFVVPGYVPPPTDEVGAACLAAVARGIGVFAGCGNVVGDERPQYPACFTGVTRCAWDRWIPPFATACWPSGDGMSSVATGKVAGAYCLWLNCDNNYVRTKVRDLPLPNHYLHWLLSDLPRLQEGNQGVPYCGDL